MRGTARTGSYCSAKCVSLALPRKAILSETERQKAMKPEWSSVNVRISFTMTAQTAQKAVLAFRKTEVAADEGADTAGEPRSQSEGRWHLWTAPEGARHPLEQLNAAFGSHPRLGTHPARLRVTRAMATHYPWQEGWRNLTTLGLKRERNHTGLVRAQHSDGAVPQRGGRLLTWRWCLAVIQLPVQDQSLALGLQSKASPSW
ncbi:uncharacterized protein LOC135324324 [Dromaius novaehollandiae]|uniref:uncharacterized protein LOC135324324 n=1 Tax=Dromaius novaehollandiae TaxID=8790 RepID=UPI00311D41BE